MKQNLILLLFLSFTTLPVWAQNQAEIYTEQPPVDGYAVSNDIQQRRVLPYSNVRSSDVVFSKRVWRELNLADEKNFVFISPKARLIDVLVEAIQAGELTAYDPVPSKEDPTGDSFLKRLPPGQAFSRLVDSVLIPEFDEEGNEIGSTLVAGEFDPDQVTGFRIKEDWFFDKQRSIFEARIVGLAPLMRINLGGVELDEQPIFWVYFPEARNILINKEVADPMNDAVGISFDDLFTRRLFASTIIKESNPQDLRLRDLASNPEEEAKRIEERLAELDGSIWVDLPEAPQPKAKKAKKEKKRKKAKK